MAFIRFLAKDYPGLKNHAVGDRVTITIKGSVALHMPSSLDEFSSLDVSDLQIAKDEDAPAEHPSEYLKRIAQATKDAAESVNMQSVQRP